MIEETLLFNPLNYQMTFQNPHRLTEVNSWHKHIPFAFTLVEMLRPSLFVELGTHSGDSYSAFCQAVDTLGLKTLCYAVDTWKGDEHAGNYGETIYEELKAYHDPRYESFSTLLRCTFDQALERFSDGSIDLLHIDGLHIYEAVRHDFEAWLPKMSRSGIVLLHDINVYQDDFGVWKLWQELQAQYPNLTFKHGYGLGVVAVGERIPTALQGLFADERNTKAITNYFARLGEQVGMTYQTIKFEREQLAKNQHLQELEQYVIKVETEFKKLDQYRQQIEKELTETKLDAQDKQQQLATAHSWINLHSQKLEAALNDMRGRVKEVENNRSSRLETAEQGFEQLTTLLKLRLAELEQSQLEVQQLQTERTEYLTQIQEMKQYVLKVEEDRANLIRQLVQFEADLRALQNTRTVKVARKMGAVLEGPTLLARSLSKSPIEGSLDRPGSGASVTETLELSGWAYSRRAEIEKIEVLLGGNLLGVANYGLERPDVIATRPWQSVKRCGYVASLPLKDIIVAGQQALTVRITDSQNNQKDFTVLVTVKGN